MKLFFFHGLGQKTEAKRRDIRVSFYPDGRSKDHFFGGLEWLMELCLSLRIIGPSNGEVWACTQNSDFIEGSGFLGHNFRKVLHKQILLNPLSKNPFKFSMCFNVFPRFIRFHCPFVAFPVCALAPSPEMRCLACTVPWLFAVNFWGVVLPS